MANDNRIDDVAKSIGTDPTGEISKNISANVDIVQELLNRVQEMREVMPEAFEKASLSVTDFSNRLKSFKTDVKELGRKETVVKLDEMFRGMRNEITAITENPIVGIVDPTAVASISELANYMETLFVDAKMGIIDIIKVRDTFSELSGVIEDFGKKFQDPMRAVSRQVQQSAASVAMLATKVQEIQPEAATELVEVLKELKDPKLLTRPVEDLAKLHERMMKTMSATRDHLEAVGKFSGEIATYWKQTESDVKSVGTQIPGIEAKKKPGEGLGVVAGAVGKMPGMEAISGITNILAGGFTVLTVIDAVAELIKGIDRLIVMQQEAQRAMTAPGIVVQPALSNALVDAMKTAIARRGLPGIRHEDVTGMLEPLMAGSNELMMAGTTLINQIGRVMEEGVITEEFNDALFQSTMKLATFSRATGISVADLSKSFVQLARTGAIENATIDEGIDAWSHMITSAKDAEMSLEDFVGISTQVQNTTKFMGMSIREADGVVRKWTNELKRGTLTTQDLTSAFERAMGVMPLEDLILEFELMRDVVREGTDKDLQNLFNALGTMGPEKMSVFFRTLHAGEKEFEDFRKRYPEAAREIENVTNQFGGVATVSEKIQATQEAATRRYGKLFGGGMWGGVFAEMFRPAFGMPTAEQNTIEEFVEKLGVMEGIMSDEPEWREHMSTLQEDARDYQEKVLEEYKEIKTSNEEMLNFWHLNIYPLTVKIGNAIDGMTGFLDKNSTLLDILYGPVSTLNNLLLKGYRLAFPRGVEEVRGLGERKERKPGG